MSHGADYCFSCFKDIFLNKSVGGCSCKQEKTMRDKRFLQKGFNKQLSHVVEECGEVLAAAGKTQRWGKDSVNPLLPPEQQETNLNWLKRELTDLKLAIERLEKTIGE